MFWAASASTTSLPGRFERLKIADQGGGSEDIEIVHSLSREGDAIYAGTYAGFTGSTCGRAAQNAS